MHFYLTIFVILRFCMLETSLIFLLRILILKYILHLKNMFFASSINNYFILFNYLKVMD
jgi:hypothetical protein